MKQERIYLAFPGSHWLLPGSNGTSVQEIKKKRVTASDFGGTITDVGFCCCFLC